MLYNDNQIITLAIVVLCIIICFQTGGPALCIIIGLVLISINSNGSLMDSIVNFPPLIPLFNNRNIGNNSCYYVPPKVKVIESKPESIEQFYSEPNINSGILLDTDIIADDLYSNIDSNINSNVTSSVESTDLNTYELPIKMKKRIPTETKKDKFEEPNVCNTDNIIDGDERIAYNSIYRNEPTRVIVGIGKAFQNLSKYLQEEVEEIEGKDWWGNNDY